MASRVDQLIAQRDLQQKLANEQLELLKNKQEELKLLEAKLESLEKQQQESVARAAEGEISRSEPIELDSKDENSFMESLMKNPEFRSKIETLQQQSQELENLEAQLAELKSVKANMGKPPLPPASNEGDKELINAIRAFEQILNSNEPKQDDNNETMENLMERLFSASLEQPDAGDAQATITELETHVNENVQAEINDDINEDESEDLENDEELQNDAQELDGTKQKIEFAISQISQQLKELQQSEQLVATSEEREYFNVVVMKLKDQLAELLEMKEKLMILDQLMTQPNDEDLGNGVLVEVQNTEELEGEEDSNSDPTVVVKAEPQTNTVESNFVEPVTESAKLPTNPFMEDLRRKSTSPAMSRATSVSTRKQSQDARSRKLFNRYRDTIYEKVTTLLSAYETRPHFVISTFKKLTQLADNDYAQQQILMLLDDLIEEQMLDQEAEDLEVFDETFAHSK